MFSREAPPASQPGFRLHRRDRCSAASDRNPRVVARLERLAAEEGDTKQGSLRESLPPFLVYQANICRLLWFRSPLPREIVHFYTKLATIAEQLDALAAPTEVSMDSRADYARSALIDIRETLELGDALLRHLRPLVSKHRSVSISRA